ncbi:hypothetical protein E3N88_15571 [Mikania micrantha]|uniref:Uncharacterized protein n=1 Tax=Mikania micrantha TaxID=192012 RepID=A0A5N6NXL3_9ASTR|nr:hypothetical protein E3N88_15571 [Mikania micrantha]
MSILDAHGLLETVEPRDLGKESDAKKLKQALAYLFQAIMEEIVELEGLRMKEGELVDDYATKLSGLVSMLRSLGHEVEEEEMVRRILDAMPKSFLQIVASIEQCFEWDTMFFDEVVGRLKAYEERLKSHG